MRHNIRRSRRHLHERCAEHVRRPSLRTLGCVQGQELPSGELRTPGNTHRFISEMISSTIADEYSVSGSELSLASAVSCGRSGARSPWVRQQQTTQQTYLKIIAVILSWAATAPA